MSTGLSLPLKDRKAWTLRQAAAVFNLPYEDLLAAARVGILPTYHPKQDGTGWPNVTEKAMNDYIQNFIDREGRGL